MLRAPARVFALRTHRYGVWWGLTAGLATASVLSCWALSRVDWKAEAALAAARVGVGAGGGEGGGKGGEAKVLELMSLVEETSRLPGEAILGAADGNAAAASAACSVRPCTASDVVASV